MFHPRTWCFVLLAATGALCQSSIASTACEIIPTYTGDTVCKSSCARKLDDPECRCDTVCEQYCLFHYNQTECSCEVCFDGCHNIEFESKLHPKCFDFCYGEGGLVESRGGIRVCLSRRQRTIQNVITILLIIFTVSILPLVMCFAWMAHSKDRKKPQRKDD